MAQLQSRRCDAFAITYRKCDNIHAQGMNVIAFTITFMPHAWCPVPDVQNVAVSRLTFVCALCKICLGTK